MSLLEYSIDDLHQVALAEAGHEQDAHAVVMLNAVYDSLRREYFIAMLLRREYSEERS